jgi:hypothetical protein
LLSLSKLRQMIAPTPQAIVEFAPLTIPGSSKPSLSNSKRKKQRSNIMAHQIKSIPSLELESLIFTLVE